MRRAIALLLAAASALFFAASWGCAPETAPAGDDCQKARAVFTKCGVTVPLLTDGPCTGVQHAIARCVANHATSCEELASLVGRLDVCAADELDGGDLPPLTDLPVAPPFDAGRDTAAEASLLGADATVDEDGGPLTVPRDGGAQDAADGAADAKPHTPTRSPSSFDPVSTPSDPL